MKEIKIIDVLQIIYNYTIKALKLWKIFNAILKFVLIKSAVEAVKGDLSNIDGMRAAMKTANFPSVRGKFSYGNNHFPIQNFYSRKVVKDSEGVWTTSVQEVVLKNHQDTYAKDCSM